jgi:hypothetical protein
VLGAAWCLPSLKTPSAVTSGLGAPSHSSGNCADSDRYLEHCSVACNAAGAIRSHLHRCVTPCKRTCSSGSSVCNARAPCQPSLRCWHMAIERTCSLSPWYAPACLPLYRDPEPGVQDAVLDQVQSLVLTRVAAAAKQGPTAKSEYTGCCQLCIQQLSFGP